LTNMISGKTKTQCRPMATDKARC